MPILIDASSPTKKTVDTVTGSPMVLTSNSFTPPAGSLVVVWTTLIYNDRFVEPTCVVTNSGVSATWTQKAGVFQTDSSDGKGFVHFHYYAASPGAITVTSTVTTESSGGGRGFVQDIKVLTGGAESQTGSLVVKNTPQVADYVENITTTLVDSVVFGFLGGYTYGETASVSGFTEEASSSYLYDTGSNKLYSKVAKTGATVTPSTLNVGWNFSGSASSFGFMVLWEVLPSSAPPPPPPAPPAPGDPYTIAISSTSPTPKRTDSPTGTPMAITSNTFTPPDKSLVAVWSSLVKNTQVTEPVVTLTSNPATTWTAPTTGAFQTSGSDGKGFLHYHYYETSPGPITVTSSIATSSTGGGFGLTQDIKVLTGAKATQTGAIQVFQNTATADWVNNITTTARGSVVFGFIGTHATTAVTLSSSTNMVEEAVNTYTAGPLSSQYVRSRLGKTAATVVPALVDTGWNISTTTNNSFQILWEVLAEVAPASGGAGGSVSAAPPQSVLDTFLAPTSRLEQRMEICEFDGVTPWKPELWNALVDGTVTVSYDSDERRNLDMTLDNFDGSLNHNPSNLWYDKVFKLFYGIHVDQKDRSPSIVIAEEFNAVGQALAMKNLLNAAGYNKVRVNVNAAGIADLIDYDIVISISADYTHKLALLQEAFGAGKCVLTANPQSTAAQLPYLISTAAAGTTLVSGTHEMRKNTANAHPVQTGWVNFIAPSGVTYRKITAITAGAVQAGDWWDATNGSSPGLIAKQDSSGARWVHLQHFNFTMPGMTPEDVTSLQGLLGSIASWLDIFDPVDYWEVQIGEFVPIQIGVDSADPELLRITGKDYTDRCLYAKLPTATTFSAGTSIDGIVLAQASNSKCFKTALPPSLKVLPKDVTYEADTERWKIMKELSNSINYEIYFNSMGYLTWRPYQDPLLTPPTLILSSGPAGNLVTKSSTASSSRLRNHIVVRGESSDMNVLPVWAEAKNTQPTSPSRISKIGDRMESFVSALFTTTAQCQEAATMLLRVSALEEFAMDFSAILFPWIECGEILELAAADTTTAINEPQRFLISSLSLPLNGEPMSGNGKRVTVVV